VGVQEEKRGMQKEKRGVQEEEALERLSKVVIL